MSAGASFEIPKGAHSNFGRLSKHIMLMLLLDRIAYKKAGRPIQILEIGVWIGFLTRSLCDFLHSRQIDFRYTCIDSWLPYHNEHDLKHGGAAYRDLTSLLEQGSIQACFESNLSPFIRSHQVEVAVGSSEVVLPQLSAEYDFIFVDGSHYYSNVIRDLKLSEGLLAAGGVMAGDDFEGSDLLDDVSSLDGERDTIEIRGRKMHPGVVRAVTEFFGHTKSWDGTWAYQKQGNDYVDAFTLLSGEEVWVLPGHFNDSQRSMILGDLANSKTALSQMTNLEKCLNLERPQKSTKSTGPL